MTEAEVEAALLEAEERAGLGHAIRLLRKYDREHMNSTTTDSVATADHKMKKPRRY
jgi:hypothetical protein